MTYEKLLDLLRASSVSLAELEQVVGLSFRINLERSFERVNLETNLLCCTANCGSCKKLTTRDSLFVVEGVEKMEYPSRSDYVFILKYGVETVLITRPSFYIRLVLKSFALEPQN